MTWTDAAPSLDPGGRRYLDLLRSRLYRREHGVADQIVGIDRTGIFWQKSAT
jgi:hypothetical protein